MLVFSRVGREQEGQREQEGERGQRGVERRKWGLLGDILVHTYASSANMDRKFIHSEASRYTAQPLHSSDTASRS